MYMEQQFYYLPIGSESSPANVLDKSKTSDYMRLFSKISPCVNAMIECITNDFEGLHENIRISSTCPTICDKYGFDYTAGYAKIHEYIAQFNVDNIVLGDWCIQYSDNNQKYGVYIEEFKKCMEDDVPVIVMVKSNLKDVVLLKDFLEKQYDHKVFYFLVATCESGMHENIFTIQPEKTGIGNEHVSWEIVLNNIKAYHLNKNVKMPQRNILAGGIHRQEHVIHLKSAKKNNIRSGFKLAFSEK